jgi:hypothetical protein
MLRAGPNFFQCKKRCLGDDNVFKEARET